MTRKPLTVENFMEGLQKRNPGEPEFHQAVHEVARVLIPFIQQCPDYQDGQILERLTEPDRIIVFRVCWHDDDGNIRTNQGYRVQFNNAIGPYKGGLRFTRDLNLSVLKFLGFDQIFKNSLTTLPLGGAKGGANFNPKGKSDAEVMRFCQAFMTELVNYIGPDKDVPAGDIGVGNREISYLFGQYKRLTHHFSGVLTGKSLSFGGSHIRTEATGYGCAYFIRQVLAHRQDSLEGKRCVVSGAGNVAFFCARKLVELGARVLTLSDTSGYLYDPEGFDAEKLSRIQHLKFRERARLDQHDTPAGMEFHAGKPPWDVPCDIAVPCATQNEIGTEEARSLHDNGCQLVVEGANMPVTLKACDFLAESGMGFVPGKAANAGGVAISGLEMSQNAMGLYWSEEEMEDKLRDIMERIHGRCLKYGESDDGIDYVKGANIAGFVKVADAMLAYGAV